MKIETKFNFGDIVKDVTTGFTGRVMATDQWETGCFRARVVPKELDRDGNPKQAQWIDEPYLELVSNGKSLRDVESKNITSGPGGPRETNQDFYTDK